MLEYKGYIDRSMFLQYRSARKLRIPIYMFRNGLFVKARKIRMINKDNEAGAYAK